MLVDPPLCVGLAELDQFLGELAGEEHVAQKLAVHRVGTAVHDLSQQPQIPRTGPPGATIVLAVDAAGDLADRGGVLGRDEDVGHRVDRLVQATGLRVVRSEAGARTSILGGDPGRDQRVSVGQRADVLGQRVTQRGVQQVRGPDVEVGLVVGRWRAARGDGVERDHDHPLGAQPQRRLDRRVQARPTVEVPAGRLLGLGHAHGREQRRDRRGRQDMLRAEVGGRDVLDPAQRIVWVSRVFRPGERRPSGCRERASRPPRAPTAARGCSRPARRSRPALQSVCFSGSGCRYRRGVQAAHRQKLADVAREPSHPPGAISGANTSPNRSSRQKRSPSSIASSTERCRVGRQIRRDQRPRARPDDHPHLILELAQQHRQRPDAYGSTRPTPTQTPNPHRPLDHSPRSRSQPTRITATRAHPAAPEPHRGPSSKTRPRSQHERAARAQPGPSSVPT